MQTYGAAASPGEGAAFAAAQAALRGLDQPATAAAMYTQLEAAYYNGQTYDEIVAYLRRMAGNTGTRTVKPLKNPAYRVVEFHAAHLWPGESLEQAFRFETGTAEIERTVRQIWAWSNFGAKRQMFARRYAMLGNLFLKVAQTPDKQRVFFRYLDPRWVTRFLFDDQDRGYLVYIRLDIPVSQIDANGDDQSSYVTEIWDKGADHYIRWEHKQGAGASPEVMGTPVLEGIMSRLFGIDFIPIVHAPFKDDASGLGLGAYQIQLPKIEEANRLATELHGKLFRHNQPTNVVMANSVDKSGRPMPAPRIPGIEGYLRRAVTPGITYGTDGAQDTPGTSSTVEVVNVGDEQWIYLGGNASIESLIPKIAWADALAILDSYMGELADDLPEMVYSQIRGIPGDASGEALRIRLMAAIDKAFEARANVLPALVRANQMAITLGQNGSLFDGLGRFEDGGLDHSLTLLPVIPQNDLERLDADAKRAANAVVKDQAGWPRRVIFTEAGYTAREADQMIETRNEQNEESVALAQRAFDRGDNVDGLGGNEGGTGGDGSTDGESE